MGNIITDKLLLVIDASTGGAVTSIKKVAASSTEQATAQERAALAAAKLTASQDVLAVSAAKLQVAQAKQAGDTAAVAVAQTSVTAATSKAAVSKAEAAVASNKLAVADLQAAAAARDLAASSAASGGMLETLGLKGAAAGTLMAAAFSPAGLAVGALLGGKLLLDGVTQFERLTEQVRSFQLATGASAPQASELVGQLKALGVEPDVAARGLTRLGASIGDGTDKLSKFGIEVAHNADGTTNLAGTFENLRAAYNASTDAATRDAIAKQIGLRGAQQLAPLLALNTQQIKDLNAATAARGEIFSQKDVNSGHDLAVASAELKQSFQGLEVEIAKGLVPALTTTETWFQRVASAAKWPAKLIEPLIHATQGIRDYNKGQFDAVTGTKDATDAVSKQNAQLSVLATNMDTISKALVSDANAEKAVRDAAQSVTDARQSETDAEKSLNDLRAAGPVDTKAVAQAEKDLAAASADVTRAVQSETDAQAALNKARQKATELDLAEANSKIALAGDKIGQAQAAEQQAKEKLDVLLGSGSASASEIAAAQAEVKARHDEVTQAVLDQKQATVDLQAVQKKGTEQDPAVQAAERTVRDAHQSVADAISRRSDAEANLREKETPDPAFADKLAKAVAAVGKAHQSVADALDNQVVAALALGPAQQALADAGNNDAAALRAVYAELSGLNSQGINPGSFLSLLASQNSIVDISPANEPNFGPPGGPPVTDTFTGEIPHRAGGGPVSAYKDYLVGEKGPEILRMGSAGGAIQANTGASITYSPTIQVTGGSNMSQLAQEIVRAASWDLRTTVLPRIHQRQ